jgi:hypothetical protein
MMSFEMIYLGFTARAKEGARSGELANSQSYNFFSHIINQPQSGAKQLLPLGFYVRRPLAGGSESVPRKKGRRAGLPIRYLGGLAGQQYNILLPGARLVLGAYNNRKMIAWSLPSFSSRFRFLQLLVVPTVAMRGVPG